MKLMNILIKSLKETADPDIIELPKDKLELLRKAIQDNIEDVNGMFKFILKSEMEEKNGLTDDTLNQVADQARDSFASAEKTFGKEITSVIRDITGNKEKDQINKL